jgi:DNA-binding NarL/FixJ family response regulator
MSIRVLLVDDHRIVRDGLKAILDSANDIEVVAEATNGREALAKTIEHHPDVVVMDLNMMEMGGVESTRLIVKKVPESKVLILSMLINIRCVADCLKAGARGYLLKDCAGEELINALHTIAAGDPFLCTKITELLIKDYAQNSLLPDPNSSRLSTREMEVLQMIADGKSTKEIAFDFGVCIKTVEVQRINIMKKLDLHNVAALTKYAIREGLTSMD